MLFVHQDNFQPGFPSRFRWHQLGHLLNTLDMVLAWCWAWSWIVPLSHHALLSLHSSRVERCSARLPLMRRDVSPGGSAHPAHPAEPAQPSSTLPASCPQPACAASKLSAARRPGHATRSYRRGSRLVWSGLVWSGGRPGLGV